MHVFCAQLFEAQVHVLPDFWNPLLQAYSHFMELLWMAQLPKTVDAGLVTWVVSSEEQG